jgi:hypothetical protein
VHAHVARWHGRAIVASGAAIPPSGQ